MCGRFWSSGYRGAHVGPPLDRRVVRVWDPLCASRLGKVGFGGGIAGNIFIFWSWGVARAARQAGVLVGAGAVAGGWGLAGMGWPHSGQRISATRAQ
jgi:hypothetical protein